MKTALILLVSVSLFFSVASRTWAATTVNIYATDADKPEGNSGVIPFSFTVVRGGDTSGTTHVNWTLTNMTDTATANDFASGVWANGGALTFTPGVTNLTITVNVATDTTKEFDEGFYVYISSPEVNLFQPGNSYFAQGVIRNDDAEITLQAIRPNGEQVSGYASRNEGNSGSTPFTFLVARDGDLSAGTTVDWMVSGSGPNAASAGDFTGNQFPSGTVTFNTGVNLQVITVNVAGDTTLEPDEPFTVTISNTGDGEAIINNTLIGTIKDDELRPEIVDTLAGAPAAGPPAIITPGSGVAQPFTTDNRTYKLDSITMDMSTTPGTSVELRAHDASSNAPGTLLESWLVSTNSTNFVDFVTHVSVANVTLQPNTKYWIVVFVNSGFAFWNYHLSEYTTNTGPGTVEPFFPPQFGPSNIALFAVRGQTGNSLSVAAASADKAEGNSGSTAFTFLALRSADTNGPSSVSWAVAGVGPNPALAADFTGGTFPTGMVNFAAGETAKTITVNVNGDTTVEADKKFRVSLNSPGSGSSLLTNLFTLASSPAVGQGPDAVVVEDINRDGWPDLISADTGAGTITVLTNNRSGGFVAASTNTVTSGWVGFATLYQVTVADLNRDGWPDLIAPDYQNGMLHVLTNNAGNGFVRDSSLDSLGSQSNGAPGYYAFGLGSAVAADVNRDGWPDLLTADYTMSQMFVLTNKAGQGFDFGPGMNPQTFTGVGIGAGATAFIAADVNGDGWMDFITADSGGFSIGSTLTVLTNNRSGGLALASTLNVGQEPRYVAASDLNGDGWVDLISANATDNTLTVLTNNRSGGFAQAALHNVGNRPNWVVARDVNGDGSVDLISANQGDSTLTVLANNGSGVFGFAATLPAGSGARAVAAADVNGDGRIDLVSANETNSTLSVLLGAPNSTTFGVIRNDDGVSAPVIVNNLSNSAAGSQIIFNGGADAQMFITDNNSYQFSGLSVLLAAVASGSRTAEIQLRAHDSTNNRPGTILETWSGITVANASFQNFSRTSVGGVTLAANTKYWVLVRTISGTSLDWQVTDSPGNAGPATLGGLMVNTNYAGTNWTQPALGAAFHQLTVLGTAQAPVAPPRINISLASSTLKLAWPASATGYLLEESASLNNPNWQPAPESPGNVNGTNQVTRALSAGANFFRLRKP